MSFLLLIVGSCKDDPPVQPPPPPPPPPDVKVITLTLEEVGVTDAVLRVRFSDTTTSWRLALWRDGSTLRTLLVHGRDTLLTDEGLEPSRTYTYQAVRYDDTTVHEKSNELRVTTMAPTSSAFQWRLDSLAGGTSSTLFDVAIVNDTLVYAVGDLYLSGETKRYNLALWNGKEWKIQRITYNYQGFVISPTLWGVYALGPNDIWFVGGAIFHYDGNEFNYIDFPAAWGPNRIYRVWGTSSSNVFIVGENGSIAHYNGSTWRKIESGTTLPIRGLYGAMKKDGSGHEILCVADSYMEPEGSKVIKIEDNKASEVWNDRRDFGLEGIWFVPGKRYIVVGDGFWETDTLTKPFKEDRDTDVLNTAFMTSVNGIDNRDIVVAGGFKLLAHFNGYKWTSFFPFSSGAFGSVKIKGNLIVATGLDGRYAIAAIGRR